MSLLLADNRRDLVAQLAAQLRGWETGGDSARGDLVSTGCPALDALLPHGGLCPGTLLEWVADGLGAGAVLLALAAARAICGESGWLVVVDANRTFFPPAAAALGIRLKNLLLVRPRTAAEARWATDQALRCPGIAAVLAWPARLDPPTFRRWQLAAEESGVLGLLVRPRAAMRESSWAAVRLLVKPVVSTRLHACGGLGATGGSSASVGVKLADRADPALADEPPVAPLSQELFSCDRTPFTGGDRGFRVELLHARGGWGGRTAEVHIDAETGQLSSNTAAHVVRVVPAVALAAPA